MSVVDECVIPFVKGGAVGGVVAAICLYFGHRIWNSHQQMYQKPVACAQETDHQRLAHKDWGYDFCTKCDMRWRDTDYTGRGRGPMTWVRCVGWTYNIDLWCRNVCLVLLGIWRHRSSVLNINGIDVARLIVRQLWKSRYTKEWTRP